VHSVLPDSANKKNYGKKNIINSHSKKKNSNKKKTMIIELATGSTLRLALF
jgi:hypothetical protein